VKSAIVAAIVAAVVGSSTAAATSWINGRSIRPHSIPLNRLVAIPRGKRGRQGRQGPQGAQGLQGSQGVAGTFDPSKVSVVVGSSQVPGGDEGGATANCPAGAVAVGGGGLTSGIENLQGSWPDLTGPSYPTGWMVLYGNTGSGTITVSAYAVCAAP
jgi:hypothetical protein